jgi:hypothetical protein
MVRTSAVEHSKNPCHHRCLPFPFDTEINIMNAFGGRNCIIIVFGMPVLAGGGRASHFLVKTPTKERGNDLEEPWGRIES